MRARVAYISSLGTTAILVAAALLMLAVVGAIVTFRGWPGAANAAGVQSVPLPPSLTQARTALIITPVKPARALIRARAAAARRFTSTAGLVKIVGPRAVSGVVRVPGRSAPPMRGVFPQPGRPLPAFPAPSGRNPVTVSLPQASPDSGPSRLVPVQLPNPSAAAPVTSTVSTLVGHVPPPRSVVRGVRSALPSR
jgi:hypothetical protein